MTVDLKLQDTVIDPGARNPDPSDAEALACLMIEAYRGSADDEGATIEEARQEIQRLLHGEYGEFLSSCSEVIEREGSIVAATLMTFWQGAPLVAFSMTAPAWKRRGLARDGLRRCMNKLLRQCGDCHLHLCVTKGNEPAEQLYESLGFRET